MVSDQRKVLMSSDADTGVDEDHHVESGPISYPSLRVNSGSWNSDGDDEDYPDNSGVVGRRPATPTEDYENEDEVDDAMETSGIEDHQRSTPSTPLQQSSSVKIVNGLATPPVTAEKATLQPFTAKRMGPESMEKILGEMCQAMRKIPEKSAAAGFVYTFAPPTEDAKYFKVGRCREDQSREAAHQNGCNLQPWALYKHPQLPVKEYARVESLVLKQLRNYRCIPDCHCKSKHREYLVGNMQEGVNKIYFWIDWIERENPFGDDRLLTPFWEERVNAVDTRKDNRLRNLFECQRKECPGKDAKYRGACQDCLDAGWEQWARPTPFDRFEYACHSQLTGWVGVQSWLPWLWPYLPIPGSVLFWVVKAVAGLNKLHILRRIMVFRLILCLVVCLYCGTFFSWSCAFEGGSSLGLIYLVHDGLQATESNKAPPSKLSTPTRSKSPKSKKQAVQMFETPGNAGETTPSTQEMTQVTPQNKKRSRTSPQETPSRLPKSRTASRKVVQQIRAVSASLPDTEASAHLNPITQMMGGGRRRSIV